MPTKRAFFSQPSFNELYGVVIGLYGDPANQVVSNDGTSLATSFTLIGWDDYTNKLLATLLWSRIVLVELLTPNDTSYNASKLALVVRPRSLWMYYKNASLIADFIGNTVNPTEMGLEGHTEIADVAPPYRYGDMIRVGTLPAPITLQTFSDNFTRTYTPQETYNGDFVDSDNIRTYTMPGGGIQNLSILGGTYNSSIYKNFQTTEILYYDKNVDARSRIAGEADNSGDSVIIQLCVGGVPITYNLRGERLA